MNESAFAKPRGFASGRRLPALWLLIAVVAAIGGVSRAETDGALLERGLVRNDTLLVSRDDVVQAALANNEMLAASGAMRDAAGADALGAWRGFLPRLSVGAYRLRTDDALYGFGFKLNQRRATQADFSAPPMDGMPAPAPFGDALNYPGVSENNITQIKLQQPVFNGGMAIYGKQAADAMSRAAANDHLRAEDTIRFHAVQAYEGLVLARAYLNVMESALASADGHVDRAQAMYDNEMVTEADLLQARVYRAGVAQRLIEVRNMAEVAGEYIELLTASETDLVLAPADDSETRGPVSPPLFADRPDVMSSRQQADAAADMAKVARGRMLPHLNLSAEKNWFHREDFLGDEADSWTFGIYATWDVFSGLENVGALRKARAQSRAASHMSDFMTRQARVEATQADLELGAAEEKLSVAEDAVEAAREGLRIVDTMYREGLVSMVDLLDVQTRTTAAEANLVQARHDYNVSAARVDYAGVVATSAREDVR